VNNDDVRMSYRIMLGKFNSHFIYDKEMIYHWWPNLKPGEIK